MGETVGYFIGGLVLSAIMGGGKKDEATPTPPPLAEAPKSDVAATEADKAGLAAQKKQRDAAAAAVGRGDTLLTGPGGLGDTASAAGFGSQKTLLGS